ncbi:MAG: Sec-independent protein translocase protein TatB [Desulfovibrionaceae bacterium]
MFGIGSTELVIIIIVALIVVGPSKLPQLMRSVGKGLAELRSVGSDVKSTLEREVDRAERDKDRQKAKEELNRKAAAEASKEKTAASSEEKIVASKPSKPAEPADTAEISEPGEASNPAESAQTVAAAPAAEDGDAATQTKGPSA